MTPKQLQLFRNMQSTPYETAMAFDVNGTGELEHIAVRFGHELSVESPDYEITAHSHPLLQDGVERMDKHGMPQVDYSTDYPSPEDFAVFANKTLYGGLVEHVIFTPSYIWSVEVRKEAYTRWVAEAEKEGANDHIHRVAKSFQDKYAELIKKHGRNYGTPFRQDWIQAMSAHFDIHRCDGYDNACTVQMVPIEEAGSHKYERSFLVWEDADGKQQTTQLDGAAGADGDGFDPEADGHRPEVRAEKKAEAQQLTSIALNTNVSWNDVVTWAVFMVVAAVLLYAVYKTVFRSSGSSGSSGFSGSSGSSPFPSFSPQSSAGAGFPPPPLPK